MVSKVIFLVTIGILAASAAVLEHDGDSGPLSNTCLKCIHEVVKSETECNRLKCGPMQISPAQWRNAYNIRVDDEVAYFNCISNHWCAVRTVQEYMTRNLPLCVRRTPAADSYRTTCEAALILHTGDEASCLVASNTGEIQENRDKLLACLDRRASAWLSEGEEEEGGEAGSGDSAASAFVEGDVSGVDAAEDSGVENIRFAEMELTENNKEDSIQERKADLNIFEILNEM